MKCVVSQMWFWNAKIYLWMLVLWNGVHGEYFKGEDRLHSANLGSYKVVARSNASARP